MGISLNKLKSNKNWLRRASHLNLLRIRAYKDCLEIVTFLTCVCHIKV